MFVINLKLFYWQEFQDHVTPLFKKGSRWDASNFRPVSLISVVCKAMECLIHSHITNYLVEHNLIIKQQHDFVNNKTCNTNLLELNDFMTNVMEEKGSMDIIYLDF